MKKVRRLAFIGFMLVILVLSSCAKEKAPSATATPPPPGHENFVMPEERPNSKGGFQKSFPKPSQRP